MAIDERAKAQSSARISALFHEAVAYHGRGQLAQAEPLYRKILGQAPAHFDALHLLGLVCHQTGRQEAAVQLMRQAIAADSSQAAVYSNLGLALRALQRHNEALASYDRALALDSRFAEALNNRGNVLRDLGRSQEALDSYDRALAINAGSASAFNNRGMALRDLKRLPEALESYRRALQLKPDYAQAHLNRGIALLETKRPQEALASFDCSLSIDPDDPAALCNRGNALQALKRPGEALESYDRAIFLEPDFPEALSNRGNALRDLDRPQEALATIERALTIKPDFSGALNNRGIVLRGLDRQQEALASYEQGLALDPRHADTLCNRGNVLQDLRRHVDALASYERALRSEPDHAESHWNEALCRLQVGDFAQGWPKYEWRWKTEQLSAVRNFAQPLWLGNESLSGRTILLHAEQGLGDTLLFCRYVKMVSALGASVVLEVHKPLKSLLANLEGVSHLLARGEALPEFDYHCPLGSLPLAFKTTVESIPANRGYLHCEPADVSRWRDRLGPKTLPRVGLLWRGNNAMRSLPIAEILSLGTLRAQFFSLQIEVSAADQAVLDERKDILQLSAGLRNFADAPLVELMDVIITVDTSVAHLAGAMGRPVWVLLAFNPDWRWLLDREDSPWYPSARLFRASAIGEWGSAIGRVKEALNAKLLAASVR